MFRSSLRGPAIRQHVKSQIRNQSTFRQIVKAPIFKSIFLTLLFGSVTIDLMRSRKNLEALESAYRSKIMIYEDLLEKLENGENVDISKELRLANSLTKNMYNSVTDVEFDERLEKFVTEADSLESEIETKHQTREVPVPVVVQRPAPSSDNTPKSSPPPTKLETSKFL
ncbi:hypothetical protein CAAN3_08S02718 [[Candida] anglica]